MMNNSVFHITNINFSPAFCAKTSKKQQEETRVMHTDDYATFDTVIVKKYPDDFGAATKTGAYKQAYVKASMGYTKQDIKTTPANKVKLDARRGVTIEFYDKKQNTIKRFLLNRNHNISKNTANVERQMSGETVWIKIPIREKFVKPRAELIENGKRTARIVLNEKGENIASERDEYSDEAMKKLYAAMKSLIDDVKTLEIDFPHKQAQEIFNI